MCRVNRPGSILATSVVKLTVNGVGTLTDDSGNRSLVNLTLISVSHRAFGDGLLNIICISFIRVGHRLSVWFLFQSVNFLLQRQFLLYDNFLKE